MRVCLCLRWRVIKGKARRCARFEQLCEQGRGRERRCWAAVPGDGQSRRACGCNNGRSCFAKAQDRRGGCCDEAAQDEQVRFSPPLTLAQALTFFIPFTRPDVSPEPNPSASSAPLSGVKSLRRAAAKADNSPLPTTEDDGGDDAADDADEAEGDGATYCICQQVSFGEMIGCDGDSCEREWVSPPPSLDRWSGVCLFDC